MRVLVLPYRAISRHCRCILVVWRVCSCFMTWTLCYSVESQHLPMWATCCHALSPYCWLTFTSVSYKFVSVVLWPVTLASGNETTSRMITSSIYGLIPRQLLILHGSFMDKQCSTACYWLCQLCSIVCGLVQINGDLCTSFSRSAMSVWPCEA